MSEQSKNDQESFQSLIAVFLEADARGESVEREQLLRMNPEHAESLKEFFADHDAMKIGKEPLENETLSPTSGHPSQTENG